MARLSALLARLMLSPLRAIRRRRDEANVRQLAMRLGCTIEDARRLYLLARRDGFGSAYQEVFGRTSSVGSRITATHPSPRHNDDEDPLTALLARRR